VGESVFIEEKTKQKLKAGSNKAVKIEMVL
jgi:hypothetical protein